MHRYSHNKVDFVHDSFQSQIEIEINNEFVDCKVDGYELKKKSVRTKYGSSNDEVFIPNKDELKQTNVMILFEREELMALIENGLIAVEMVLRDSNSIIFNLCYQAQDIGEKG
ncbi:hypothetical protein [Bacillus toyonensis]|uniref:hypothetical protein n=1 Tax=Bacillus toyonensis TaxID=155322 RepID=UPI001C0CFB33|nr:hypothetical protein [Bacillus toyonensis]MBU4643212.1 hypothetical protein [Bacillus toyonensis]